MGHQSILLALECIGLGLAFIPRSGFQPGLVALMGDPLNLIPKELSLDQLIGTCTSLGLTNGAMQRGNPHS